MCIKTKAQLWDLQYAIWWKPASDLILPIRFQLSPIFDSWLVLVCSLSLLLFFLTPFYSFFPSNFRILGFFKNIITMWVVAYLFKKNHVIPCFLIYKKHGGGILIVENSKHWMIIHKMYYHFEYILFQSYICMHVHNTLLHKKHFVKLLSFFQELNSLYLLTFLIVKVMNVNLGNRKYG